MNYQDLEIACESMDAAIKDLDAVIEGASQDAVLAFNSKKAIKAKNDMVTAYTLMEKGKFDEAKSLLIDAKNVFKDINMKISNRKSWPLSSVLSGLYSIVSSISIANKSIAKKIGSYGKQLSTKESITIGGTVCNIISTVIPVASIGSAGIAVSQMVVNRQEGKNIGNKMGAWNDVQRGILFVLKGFITACDDMIADCDRKTFAD